jgi:hypothetical protein
VLIMSFVRGNGSCLVLRWEGEGMVQVCIVLVDYGEKPSVQNIDIIAQ